MKNPFKVDSNAEFKRPEHQSAGILDDFAVRKNLATREGTIEKVPVNNSDIVNKKYVDDSIGAIPPLTSATLQNLQLLDYQGFVTKGAKWIHDDSQNNYLEFAGGALQAGYVGGYPAFGASSGTLYTPVTLLCVGASPSTGATLNLAYGSITDGSGAISFGDENLSTTGWITDGVFKVDNGAVTGATGNISMWTNNSNYVTPAGDDNISITNDAPPKISLIDTDSGSIETSISATAGGGMIINSGPAGLALGIGAAGVDYKLTFDGESNDGIITFMEDEKRFDIDCNSDTSCLRLQAADAVNDYTDIYTDANGMCIIKPAGAGIGINGAPDANYELAIRPKVATDNVDVEMTSGTGALYFDAVYNNAGYISGWPHLKLNCDGTLTIIGSYNAPATTLDIDSNSNTQCLRLRGTDFANEYADFYITAANDLVIDSTGLTITNDVLKMAGGCQSSDGSAGVSGSFTTTDGKTITIKNGIVTAIV